ncbi:MAG TPA: matrixin family metalloprotease [Acidimicrobiales bacterium]|nr:matrixin family metalloprotease [Acidimicrobiales bacterium]
MGISVSLRDAALAVDPGEFVRTEVVVANDGAETVRGRVVVDGPAAPHAWVVPPDVEVAPGQSVGVSVGFRVTRAPEPPAGPLAFEIRVEDGGTVAATAGGTLDVHPFHEVTVELDPADARSSGPTEHHVVLENRGNVTATATVAPAGGALTVDVDQQEVEAAPGQRVPVAVRLRPGPAPLLRPRSLPFAVAVEPAGGERVVVSGALEQAARLSGRSAGFVALAAVVVVAVVLRLTVLAPASGSKAASAAINPSTRTTATTASACAADRHREANANGLTPEAIPKLSHDYSFFGIGSDGCAPVRWNPCEPIHYIINRTDATPTGVADVQEAFRRLAAATGMTYVDDGFTDETASPLTPNRAFQPERYPGRWAPILIHWVGNDRLLGQAQTQVVGGGIPTRVGDTFVSGTLFLNPKAVVDNSGTPVPGGFDDPPTIGQIGPTGVHWGRVILHELGHITGLGHVSDPAELMYPETAQQTGTTAFHDGDLAGLRFLGKDAGCTQTPAPAPVRPRGPARTPPTTKP